MQIHISKRDSLLQPECIYIYIHIIIKNIHTCRYIFQNVIPYYNQNAYIYIYIYTYNNKKHTHTCRYIVQNVIPYYNQKSSDDATPKEEEDAEEPPPQDSEHELQLNAQVLKDLDGEYSEKFLEFGYLALFGASFPLLATLLLASTAVELRTHASRFTAIFQRPKSVFVYVCVCVLVYVCMCIRVCVCVCVCVCVGILMHVYVIMCLYVLCYIYMCVFVYVCVCVCVLVY
jgi:hypothetical protein